MQEIQQVMYIADLCLMSNYSPANIVVCHADLPDPKASPFIALLKQYMERAGGVSEGPAFSAAECCKLERDAMTACTEVAQAVAQQQASASSQQRSGLQDDLPSSICTAVKVGGQGRIRLLCF